MSNLPDPITRTEQYFNAIANGETEVPEPITREEIYLNAIAQNGGGGGGGGTTNYNQLSNKPQIGGTTLQGDKSLADLGIASNAVMTGATSAANGAKGLVPAPQIADKGKYLKGDGTWDTPEGGGGGGGHEIRDDGTAMTQREALDFTDFDLADDSEDEETDIAPHRLTSAELADIVTPLPGAPVEGVKYSTEEQIVGEWIDGKPLYQKTVSCGAMPNNTTKQVAHGISDIREVVDITGTFNNGTNFFDIPNPMPSGNYAKANVNKTYIEIETKSNLSAYTYCYVTLRYTKTTD